VQLSGPRLADVYWWQNFGWFLLQRREAWQAIHGKAPPDDPRLLLCQARLEVLLGRPGPTGKAAADFRKAVGALDGKALEAFLSRPFESEADRLLLRLTDEAVLQRLTAAVERSPGDVWKLWGRGDWHARFWRWKEAAADFTTALQRHPEVGHYWWLHGAPPVLAAGDREGYRRLCRAMLQRFGQTRAAGGTCTAAKVCLLLPGPGQDTDLACALADRALEGGKNTPEAAWYVFSKGLADYRRGNAPAAIAGLEPLVFGATPVWPPELASPCHLVLAMALHRQGKAEAARQHLARGAKLLDEHRPEPTSLRYRPVGYSHDWLIAWLLHREARALIEGEKAGPKR
jgi:hypothetical protein